MDKFEDSRDFANEFQRSNLLDINDNFQIEDRETFNQNQNYDGEPFNHFEKIINDNLNYITSKNGVLSILTINDIKNKKIENIKHLVKWIKSEHNWVNEKLKNKVTKFDDLAESNTKLADAVSRFEKKVYTNETKIEEISESIELKIKSQFEKKFQEIEKRLSDVSIKIGENMNNFNSSLHLLSNRVLVLENNYNAFDGDFNKKLESFMINNKSVSDTKNAEFDENIAELKEKLELFDKELQQIKSSVEEQFSDNKDFVDSLSEGMNLCNSELSDLKTNCLQNDIDRKIEIKNCYKEKTENVKSLSETFSKDLKSMCDSLEFQQKGILDKANDALKLAKKNENEVDTLKNYALRLDSLEKNSIKCNESINNLDLVQKDSNVVLTVLSDNAKKAKKNLNDLQCQQKEMEDNIKDFSEKQKLVEKNLAQIDALSKSHYTSIEEINKWMGEKNVWIKDSDQKYDILKRDSEKSANYNSTQIDKIMNETKKLSETSRDIIHTIDKKTNNLKHMVSKVEMDVKGQSNTIHQLSTDVKDNIRETIRVSHENKIHDTQQQDLKIRTLIEGSKIMRVKAVVSYPQLLV